MNKLAVKLAYGRNGLTLQVPADAAILRVRDVRGLPYWRGSSLQGAPVHKIYSIPSKHCRSRTRGRPPLGFRFVGGKWGSICAHCLLVSFRHAMPLGLPSHRRGF
jgi:hypothetical protein